MQIIYNRDQAMLLACFRQPEEVLWHDTQGTLDRIIAGLD